MFFVQFGGDQKAATVDLDQIEDVEILKEPLTLFHYGKLEGLPSFDPDCLRAYLLLKAKSIKFREEVCKEPLMSPNQRLPFLMTDAGRCITGGALIKTIFSQEPDFVREEHEKCEEIVLGRLRPLWTAAVWSDPSIYRFVMKPIYQPEYCRLVREVQMWRLQRSFNHHAYTDVHEAQFSAGLQILSEKLGDDPYFGGEEPSVLDASLGPDIMMIPFYVPASHRLHQIFSQYHNLFDYAIHMLHQFAIHK